MKLFNFFNKLIVILLLILASTRPASAQQMVMDKPIASDAKNVFLTIMDTMMMRMENAAKGESTGADFMLQMIPHHQGAVAMAKYEIKHGKNFVMIQMAKSILAEQQIEIQLMEIGLNQRAADTANVTAAYKQAMDKTMIVMMQNMPDNSCLNDIDHAFAIVMIPHHQAAIDMARVLLKGPSDAQTSTFARQLISSEEIEIEQMSSHIN
jgi:uncharacterized protein (DUF305 family)